MAELYRSFPERKVLTDEKSRVDREVERQRIDDPEVERQKKRKELSKERGPQGENNKSMININDIDLGNIFGDQG